MAFGKIHPNNRRNMMYDAPSESVHAGAQLEIELMIITTKPFTIEPKFFDGQRLLQESELP